MPSKSTISTFELFKLFPDAESARKYLESRLWPEGVVCPHCGCVENITTRKNGFYRCNNCHEDFSVRTGTIFERSHVPLHKWLYAMYLLVTARKGISSLQLSSVWAVLKRGVNGVYHQVSAKHLGLYVNEFTFRLNDGNVKRHTLARLDSFVAATARKRLTYARLTA